MGVCVSAWVAPAATASDDVGERLRTDPLMMPYYTGKILPTPQKAEYLDRFMPLSNVAIVVGKEVENPAPLVAVLTDRIARYGGHAAVVSVPRAEHTTVISLGETELARQAQNVPAIPEKAEGYILHFSPQSSTGRDLVIMKGHDRLGLLWAISSFIQLVHWKDGKTLVRAANLVDYPRGQTRGYINAGAGGFFYSPSYMTWGRSKDTNTPDSASALKTERQFTLLSKFNTMVYQHMLPYGHGNKANPEDGYWQAPEKWNPEVKKIFNGSMEQMSNSLTALGLSWYACVHPHVGEPADKICGSEETVDAFLYCARKLEAAGGHLDIQLDDVRFPLNPYDKEHFGSARAADTWVVTNLMVRLVKEYPKAKLLVCPPFYWGPNGGGWYQYGEDRDEYLKLIGEKWPQNVGVWWSGENVNGNPLGTKEHVSWITSLIKRKPFLWQNNAITWYAAYFFHYGAEPIDNFRDMYWDGFLESVDFYGLNSDFPIRSIATAISGDFQWNPDAYNAQESVKEAASKFISPELWDTFQKFCFTLMYFDRFASAKNYDWFYNGPFHGKGSEMELYAARNIDVMEAKIAAAEDLHNKMLSLKPAAISTWTGCSHFLGIARNTIPGVKSNPALEPYRKAPGQRRIAEKAGDYSREIGDYFLAASNFRGGLLQDVSDNAVDVSQTHPAHVLTGTRGTAETCQWLWGDDLVDRFELRISARMSKAVAKVIINLNGKEIGNLAAAFSEKAPSTWRLTIPDGLLKEKENSLQIGITIREGSNPDNLPQITDNAIDASLGTKNADNVAQAIDSTILSAKPPPPPAPPLAIQYAVFKRISDKTKVKPLQRWTQEMLSK